MHNNLYTREALLELQPGVDGQDEFRARLTFSSAAPVLQYNWETGERFLEILGHDPGEAALERLSGGAPVLYNHADGVGVVDRAWIENEKGHAEIRLSTFDSPPLNRLRHDIKTGIVRNVSVGYVVHQRALVSPATDSQPATYRATRWEPIEVSVLDIPPADATVGFGRQFNHVPKEEPAMQQQIQDQTAEALDPATIAAEASQRALEQEKMRRADVRAVFTSPALGKIPQSEIDACLDDPAVTVDVARRRALEALERHAGQAIGAVPKTVESGPTEQQKFSQGALRSIMSRAGLEQDDPASEYRGRSLLQLAERSLILAGMDTRHLDQKGIAAAAFTRASHTTSDFPYILENVANKAMLKGHSEVEEVFPMITSVGSLSDFKSTPSVGLGETDALEEVLEDGEVKYTTMAEGKELRQLGTYARGFRITRQALLNDDLGMLTDVPRKFGRAARRTVGNKVISVLGSNPTMGDGVTLFHVATHKNYTSSGTALSATSLDAARLLMRKQKSYGDKGSVLNIRPRYLVVPVALETLARQLMASAFDITTTNTNSNVPNPVAGLAEVVADARLDDLSTTAWYLFADPSANDVCEVSYLNGNPNPTLEQKTDWTINGVEYQVLLDFGVKFLDYRTVYKNAGA